MVDVAVIGAGPAGASAALFIAKAGKSVVLIDNDQSVTKRALIKNHYGLLEVTGPDLIEIGKRQATNFGAELVEAKATAVRDKGDHFTIETEKGEYSAKHVIFATGFSVDLAEGLGVQTKDGTEPRVKKIIDVDPAGKTNIDRAWAAGTCAGVSVHTIITAGDGAKVAINVISELNGERYVDHDVLQTK